MLITSISVQSLQDALERIEWYTCRWVIEEYHRCLKTGYQMEKSQLRHAERLQRLLAFLSILVVRLLQLRDLSRATPHLLAVDQTDECDDTEVLGSIEGIFANQETLAIILSHGAEHQLRSVLQRLCQMRGLDLFATRQIRDCAREFQDAMIGTRG